MRKLFYRLARLADRIMKHLKDNSGEVGQITVTHEFGSLPNEMLIDSVAEWVAGKVLTTDKDHATIDEPAIPLCPFGKGEGK